MLYHNGSPCSVAATYANQGSRLTVLYMYLKHGYQFFGILQRSVLYLSVSVVHHNYLNYGVHFLSFFRGRSLSICGSSSLIILQGPLLYLSISVVHHHESKLRRSFFNIFRVPFSMSLWFIIII